MAPPTTLQMRADELLREPGTSRSIRRTFEPAEVDAEHPRIVGAVDVDLTAESIRGVTSTDIAVSGVVTVPWASECRRCLAALAGEARVDVDERYQVVVTDPDAFAIDDRVLDLAPLVRSAVLLEAAEERLCRPDCAGLCPACGADRNAAASGGAGCDCDLTVVDDRWAVLDQLRADP